MLYVVVVGSDLQTLITYCNQAQYTSPTSSVRINCAKMLFQVATTFEFNKISMFSMLSLCSLITKTNNPRSVGLVVEKGIQLYLHHIRRGKISMTDQSSVTWGLRPHELGLVASPSLR